MKEYMFTIVNPHNRQPYRIYKCEDGTHAVFVDGEIFVCEETDRDSIIEALEDIFF